MFERIGKQFKDLGFAVVEVPFANNDLNYVNVILYTDKNTHKPTVIFPSYHFDPEDIKGKYMDEVMLNYAIKETFDRAVQIYNDNGIDVKIAPYFRDSKKCSRRHDFESRSFFPKYNSKNRFKGGLHCRLQVLQ